MVINRFVSHRYSSSVWTVLLGLSFLLCPLTLSQAQAPIVTNIQATTGGSLDLGTVTTEILDPVGTTTQITGGTRPNNGTDPGTNLFHSFNFFTLGTGDTAHFLNDMLLPTTNIFARVIGGEISTIDGTLQTNNPLDATDPMNFGAANLWLVNPSGVLLGSNARLEVGGSVSMSTANYLRFDGTAALFDMLSTPASLGQLSVAPVVAFGFLALEPGVTRGTIFVQGSMLQVLEGQSLSLVGGDITVQAGTLVDGTIQSASLRAPGGQLNLVSIASPGEVLVPSFQTGPNIEGASFNTMGTVTINGGAALDVSGQLDELGTPIGNGNGGTVFVRGGSLIVDNSTIEAKTLGDLDGDDFGIDLSVTDIVTLKNGAKLSVATGDFNMGRPGDVRITTSELVLSQGSTIGTTGSFGLAGLGAAADILLNVNSLSLTGGSTIFSTTSDVPGGNITVQGFEGEGTAANSVLVAGTDTTGLSSSEIRTETQGVGTGGKLSVFTSDLTLDDQGRITSATLFGNGQGGEIVLNVEQSVIVSNSASIRSTTDNFVDVEQGVGGKVTIQGLGGSGTSVDSVTISDRDSLETSSGIFSGSIFGVSRPGNILVDTRAFTLSDGAVVQSGSPFDISGGGSITIQASDSTFNASDSVSILNGSSISNQSLSTDAGPVSITTSALTIDNGSINTSTLSSGRAGDVIINARNVLLTNGARIESSTADVGAAGSVVIQGQGGDGTRANDVTIQGQDTIGQPGGLFTNTGKAGIIENSAADGAGGNITVVTNTFTLEDGASISASSSSISALAQGGSITVDANLATVQTGASITAESIRTTTEGGAAPGGDVVITAQALTLDNGSVSTTTAGSGDGGSITLNVGALIAQGSSQVTSSTTGAGKAGSIGMTSNNVTVTGGARIEASTTGAGDAGDITITNTDTVSVTGLSSDGSSRSGIFAKTQSSGGGTGGGSSGGGQTSTPGDAGKIDITTNTLLLSGGAQIDSSTTTSGSGGSVFVTADAITITGASTSLKSDASRGNGTGGDIELVARTIGIHDKASVTAATDGSGNAGGISMTANESFTLDSAAIITTSTRGAGNGGTILIDSPQVLVDGLGTSITASTLRPFADLAVTLNIVHPNDGDLTVRLDSPDGTRVALLSRVGGSGDNFTGTTFDDQATQPIPTTSNSAPFTGTFKPREPLAQLIDQTVTGIWKLNVNDQVAGSAGVPQNLTGWLLRVGNQLFESTNVPRNIPDSGSVSSSLVVTVPAGTVVQGVGEATGNGGDVTIINAGTVSVQNGATLSATTRGSGQGGTVSVNATGQVALAGPGAGLFTNSEASGKSGDIKVEASRMTMDNGAKISAASSGTGDAGNITINAGSEFLSSNSSVTTAATLASGGNITITSSNSVTLQDHALVSASSQGAGNAGSITINAGQRYLSTNSAVTTQAAQASGGDITVNAEEMIRLINSQINTSVAGGDATLGGNIKIDPQFVILQNSQVLAQAFAGTGGNINIISNVFLADPASIVDASSQLGISGTVNIQAPVQNVSGELVVLSQDFSSAAALLAQQCAARVADGKFSTFVVAAREGLPVEPGGLLPSPSILTELGGSALSGQFPQTPHLPAEGLPQQYDASPVQMAKLGSACRR